MMSCNTTPAASAVVTVAVPDRTHDLADLLRRLRAARVLACDEGLDPDRHDMCVTAADLTARTLYIRHGIRV